MGEVGWVVSAVLALSWWAIYQSLRDQREANAKLIRANLDLRLQLLVPEKKESLTEAEPQAQDKPKRALSGSQLRRKFEQMNAHAFEQEKPNSERLKENHG